MNLDRIGPKWIEIDLDQLQINFNNLKALSPTGKVIPSIKANAYGLGAVPIARTLEQCGCELLAVATLNEAIELRENFIKCGILVFGEIPQNELQDIVNYQLTPTICDLEHAKHLNLLSKQQGVKTSYHYYVDTGMGRMGYDPDKSITILNEILNYSNLKCEGIYSHFPVSDETDEASRAFTLEQIKTFKAMRGSLSLQTTWHMANSGACLQHPESYLDALRPGLFLYGVNPNPEIQHQIQNKPILSIKCRPLFMKKMLKGQSVGYGRNKILERDQLIATLPVGYADGIPRLMADHMYVRYREKKLPLQGRICMDMLMIAMSEGILEQDPVLTLMGDNGPSIYDWASWSQSIPYEVMTRFGPRWQYVYKKSGDIFV